MATTEAQVERVRELVASIPPGAVVTYGDIAAAAGLSSARTVGWIMPGHPAHVLPEAGALLVELALLGGPVQDPLGQP